MSKDTMLCPKGSCGKETFTRVAGSIFGHVIEDWCVCGWSKPRLLAFPGIERLVNPAGPEEGNDQRYVKNRENGRLGGLATKKKYGKVGKARKPYIRKNPRQARRDLGYKEFGALDTFKLSSRVSPGDGMMPGWNANVNFVDPTS